MANAVNLAAMYDVDRIKEEREARQRARQDDEDEALCITNTGMGQMSLLKHLTTIGRVYP